MRLRLPKRLQPELVTAMGAFRALGGSAVIAADTYRPTTTEYSSRYASNRGTGNCPVIAVIAF